MFRIPSVNVIESDEGFSVEVVDRTEVLYTEDNRKLQIDSELLAGPSGLAIYRSSIVSWAPPHNDETIDENKREEIIDNIRRAFRFRKIEIQVI
jgi:hypothetical protein